MIRESGNLNPGQLKRRALSEMHIRFGSSWFHSEPGFQAVKKAFFEAPELFAGGEVIWKTRNKAVRKVTLPAEYGGITLAFKDYAGIKPLRYALRCSKTALEAANYRAFTALGIPMATLLFAGDDRRNFRLTSTDGSSCPAAACAERPNRRSSSTGIWSTSRGSIRFTASTRRSGCSTSSGNRSGTEKSTSSGSTSPVAVFCRFRAVCSGNIW